MDTPERYEHCTRPDQAWCDCDWCHHCREFLRRLRETPCDHGAQPFCPREEARTMLSDPKPVRLARRRAQYKARVSAYRDLGMVRNRDGSWE